MLPLILLYKSSTFGKLVRLFETVIQESLAGHFLKRVYCAWFLRSYQAPHKNKDLY